MADAITNIEKRAAGYLLPEKIIIATMHIRDQYQSTFYNADYVSILPVKVSDADLGNSIVDHLQQSKTAMASNEEMKQSWKELIKKAKYKSEKAFIQKTKMITIVISDNKILFVPYKNKVADKVFLRIPDSISEINQNSDPTKIGVEVRKSWEKCLFI